MPEDKKSKDITIGVSKVSKSKDKDDGGSMQDRLKFEIKDAEIRGKLGLLFVKSFCKMMAVIFIVMELWPFQLFGVEYIGKIASLIICWGFYFSMPTRYKPSRPYKAIEAWMRIPVAIFISFLFWYLLSFGELPDYGNLIAIGGILLFGILITYFLGIALKDKKLMVTIITSIIMIVIFLTFGAFVDMHPATSIGLLSLAFFMTFPEVVKPLENEREITIVSVGGVQGAASKLTKNMSNTYVGNDFGSVIFISLALVAGLPFLISPDVTGVFKLIFGIIWVFGMLAGFAAGREGRPFIGIMVIGAALFIFMFVYPQHFGTLFLGQYYPMVENAMLSVTEPMGNMFGSVTFSMGDMIACAFEGPIVCYQRQLVRQRAASVGKGTPTSITFTQSKLIPEPIEPTDTTTYYAVLQNKGEFAAEDVSFWLSDFHYQQELDGDFVPAQSKVEVKTCMGPVPVSNLGSGNQKGCFWEGLMYSDGVYQTTFEIKWVPTLKEARTNGMNYTINSKFGYSTKVQYNLNVLELKKLNEKLMSGEILKEQRISEYSGGPLMAALQTPLQPVGSGEESLIIASLTNTMTGTVEDVDYCIYVPISQSPMKIRKIDSNKYIIETTSSPGEDINDKNGNLKCGDIENYRIVWCHWDRIDSQDKCTSKDQCDVKQCRFYLTYDIDPSPEKTFTLTGISNYKYTTTQKKRTSINIIDVMDINAFDEDIDIIPDDFKNPLDPNDP